MIRRPPRSTRTDTLFPYTTLFRSQRRGEGAYVIGKEIGTRAGQRSDAFQPALHTAPEARFIFLAHHQPAQHLGRVLGEPVADLGIERHNGDLRLASLDRVQHRPAQPPDRSLAALHLHEHGAFAAHRSEEHTSELQSLMRTPYAVF